MIRKIMPIAIAVLIAYGAPGCTKAIKDSGPREPSREEMSLSARLDSIDAEYEACKDSILSEPPEKREKYIQRLQELHEEYVFLQSLMPDSERVLPQTNGFTTPELREKYRGIVEANEMSPEEIAHAVIIDSNEIPLPDINATLEYQLRDVKGVPVTMTTLRMASYAVSDTAYIGKSSAPDIIQEDNGDIVIDYPTETEPFGMYRIVFSEKNGQYIREDSGLVDEN